MVQKSRPAARARSAPLLLALLTAPGTGLAAQERDISPKAALQFPLGVAIAADGSLYVSERQGHRVLRFDPATGTVRTVAGTGEKGFSGDGRPARAAQLACPDSIDLDAAGNLYVADRCNQRIRRVDAETGIIETVAGTGERGPGPDGPALEVPLCGPFYVRAARPGELLFTDTDSHRVRRLDLETGRIETLAGSGEGGFSGDGGPALEAAFARPHVTLRAANGDLIVGDSFNQRIRRVDAETGIVRTIAGVGERGLAADGIPALEAPFGYFGEIHELPGGDLLLTEWSNGRVLRVEGASGRVRVLAGTGDEPSAEGAGTLLSTRLGRLADMALDSRGRVVAADAEGGRLLRIDLEAGRVEVLLGPR